MTEERDFDTLLAAALAPPDRLPDAAFVARVDLAVAEAERFRRWRRRAVRRIGGEAMMLAGLGAFAVAIAQAPLLQPAFAATSLALPALAAAVLTLWMLFIPPRPGITG